MPFGELKCSAYRFVAGLDAEDRPFIATTERNFISRLMSRIKTLSAHRWRLGKDNETSRQPLPYIHFIGERYSILPPTPCATKRTVKHHFYGV